MQELGKKLPGHLQTSMNFNEFYENKNLLITQQKLPELHLVF